MLWLSQCCCGPHQADRRSSGLHTAGENPKFGRGAKSQWGPLRCISTSRQGEPLRRWCCPTCPSWAVWHRLWILASMWLLTGEISCSRGHDVDIESARVWDCGLDLSISHNPLITFGPFGAACGSWLASKWLSDRTWLKCMPKKASITRACLIYLQPIYFEIGRLPVGACSILS